MTNAPDETAICEDLSDPSFTSGADRGWWSVLSRSGTAVLLRVVARNGRAIHVRVDCAGYSAVAPTALLWSVGDDGPLGIDLWPTGGRAGEVFSKAWSPGHGGAFYWPYDRVALSGHEGWGTQHPGHIWNPETTITNYVSLLRDVVRSATGPPTGDDASAGQQ